MRGIIEVEGARSFEMLKRWPVPLVVDFWAPRCQPCLAMRPAFKKMAAKYDREAIFAKVNTDEHPELSRGVVCLPTFAVFWCGKLLGSTVGAKLLKEFDSELSHLLSRKKEIINWNYPPEDMPREEVERFWGNPEDIPDNWPQRMREKSRGRSLKIRERGRKTAQPNRTPFDS